MKRSALLAAALIAAGLTGCAPAGFVETTANVIDEMTAFRDARKKNTREAWEWFVRQYPDSGKAQQAKQWIQMMPEARADAAQSRRELAQAERERDERARVAAEVEKAEQERQSRMMATQADRERRRAEELARLEREKAAQPAEVEASTATAALLASLKKREEELAKREAAMQKREAEIASAAAAAAAAATSDDIDLIPKGGPPPNDENFAVVIGVEKYRDIAAGADYAERDARTMVLYLRDHMGFPEQNIKLLTGERASRSDFAKILELWLPLQVTSESRVFVYYSGHGAPDPNSQQAYLLPYDGDPKALELTAYPVKRLYDKLAALPAKEVVVALDSCFSGAGGRSVIASGVRPLMSRVESGRVDPSKRLTVFSASAGDEITGAFEPQKHGLFTYYFLRGVRGDADANADGTVSLDEEYAYLRKNVSRQANRDSREQTPQVQPDLSLRPDKGAAPLSRAAK